MDMGRVRARPPRDAGLPRSPRGNSIDAYLFIGRLVHKYGGVPIYTDGAGWCADACRWAGAEHIVYDRPLRNLVERVVQYVKEGTEAFDDLFPVGGRRLATGGDAWIWVLQLESEEESRPVWIPYVCAQVGPPPAPSRGGPPLRARLPLGGHIALRAGRGPGGGDPPPLAPPRGGLPEGARAPGRGALPARPGVGDTQAWDTDDTWAGQMIDSRYGPTSEVAAPLLQV
ncbi:MAG: hypothetical protein RXR82_07845 [Nitrososphaeria archaeon]